MFARNSIESLLFFMHINKIQDSMAHNVFLSSQNVNDLDHTLTRKTGGRELSQMGRIRWVLGVLSANKK